MRRHNQLAVVVLALLLVVQGASADDVYLTLEEAPRAVFPEATNFERRDIQVDESFRARQKKLLGRSKPTIWEPFYITFIARRDSEVLGYAVVCEEIGKHRPITFITAVTPDGKVKDVAVMAYREAYGGAVRYKGFTKQFQGKTLKNDLRPYRDIRNISGATLSVSALSRGVRKALTVIQLAYLNGAQDNVATK